MPREKRGDDRSATNAIDEQKTATSVAADVSTSRPKKGEENCTSRMLGGQTRSSGATSLGRHRADADDCA